MRYSVITAASKELAGRNRGNEGQKAAEAESDVNQVEHEPTPFVDIGLINGGIWRKGAISKMALVCKYRVKLRSLEITAADRTNAPQHDKSSQ